MTAERRLARLERQNRWMRAALLALVMAGAGALIMGQAGSGDVPDLIRAKKFQVVDDSGSPLIALPKPKRDRLPLRTD